MSILHTAIALIIILGILVIVHEWGHFIAARMCGIRVDEFSIGFGPRAVRIGKLGDTEYNIRWVPLGGFVKIAGMEPDEEPLIRAADKVRNLSGPRDTSGAPGEQSSIDSGKAFTEIPLVAENVPNLAETPDQRLRDETEGFYAHPLWQRAFVIFAGPFMSFVLGYVTFLALFATIGIPTPRNVVGQVAPDSEAQRIGLRPNDKIVQVNGAPVKDGEQMVKTIHSSPNKPVRLAVERGNQTITFTGTPKPTNLGDGTQGGALGFMPRFDVEHLPFAEAVTETNRATALWFTTIIHLFAHHDISEIRKSAGGPIFIAKMTNQAVHEGGPSLPLELAQLSMSLALFNLLPIPILDGGHLFMFFIEAMRRGRRLTMEQQQNFMLAGLAIIGVLFVLIMFNDIVRR